MKLLLLGSLAAGAFIAIAQHNYRAETALASNNLKQIEHATLMYSNDWDDWLPPDANWIPAIAPYLSSNAELFRSNAKLFMPFPGERPFITYRLVEGGKVFLSFGSAFIFNPSLFKVETPKVKKPAATVLWSYGPKSKLRYLFDGRTLVGFVDGHVKLVSKSEAKKLSWRP